MIPPFSSSNSQQLVWLVRWGAQKTKMTIISVQPYPEYGRSACGPKNKWAFINAALSRKEALDHTLIFGPPGLGKTTLANIIAREMGGNLRSTSGPVAWTRGWFGAMLTNLRAWWCALYWCRLFKPDDWRNLVSCDGRFSVWYYDWQKDLLHAP